MDKKKVILVIRDGWGYRKGKKDNAILGTATPNTDKLMKNYPNTLLNASGPAVGLPAHYQGNSEVGHMTLGSGRIIFQSLERINKSIKKGDFFMNQAFLQAVENCRKNNSTLHLMGLLQVEGVHSHMNHLFALLDLCKRQKFHDVYIHVITDGRDAPVMDSEKHVKSLQRKIKQLGFGEIATISGRYYAMDRDKRWERTKLAYDCIVKADCKQIFIKPMEAIKEAHGKKETDEFITPKKADWYNGMKDEDSVIFFNFRTDRPRQITQAIVEENFEGWDRKPLSVYYVAMTQYYIPMTAQVAFKDLELKDLLGPIIAQNGLEQLRISETEKYAHVTFFFNGQIEEPSLNEDRILIASPKVATYDLSPEMSTKESTAKLVEQINTDKYDFIVTNIVNGDMVGHTGKVGAIKKAVTCVDKCIGEIVKAGLSKGYTILITADHGNAEDQSLKWRTSHTLNPVQFILVSNDKKLKKIKLKKGKGLQDVAPTILKIIEIEKPKEMTGESLF